MEFDMHVEHTHTYARAHTHTRTLHAKQATEREESMCVCGTAFERLCTGMNACGVFPWELNALWGNCHIEEKSLPIACVA